MRKQLKIKVVTLPIYGKDNAFWQKNSRLIAILKYKNRRIWIESVTNPELEVSFNNDQKHVYYGKEAINIAKKLKFSDIEINNETIEIKYNNCFVICYKIKGLHADYKTLENKHESYSEALLDAIDTILDEQYYEELKTHTL